MNIEQILERPNIMTFLDNPKAMKAIRTLIKLGFTAETIGVLMAWHCYKQGIAVKCSDAVLQPNSTV